MKQKFRILLVSGPVGVGKTSVGNEIAEILERNQIPHTYVDFDQLRCTYPRPKDDPWGNRLGLENLDSIWRNCSQSGALNLVISYVVEDKSFIERLLKIIPGADVSTIQLSADTATLEARLKGREIGSGLEWHLNRASELLSSLKAASTPSDYRISTEGRDVVDIAEEIVSKIDWRMQ